MDHGQKLVRFYSEFLEKVILISCQLIEVIRENRFLISTPFLNGGIIGMRKCPLQNGKKGKRILSSHGALQFVSTKMSTS